jgi:uncharacterized protein YgiM (DUF1202 family)
MTLKKVSLTLLILFTVLIAFESTTLFCQSNRVNVRAEASIDAEILGQLNLNDEIAPIDESGNWYKITYNGQDAWVYEDFFKEERVETKKYWYNPKSGVLHNSNCRWYGNTQQGYFTNEIIGRDCGLCGGALRGEPETDYKYWINTKTNVRHNRGCRWYGNTKQGYYTNEKVGRPCKNCGG